MAVTTEWTVPQTNRTVYSGTSGDTKPSNPVAGSIFYETNTGVAYEFDGLSWVKNWTSGLSHVAVRSGGSSIVPTSYTGLTATLGTGGTGYAIASGAKYVHLGVKATGGVIYIAFGTSSANAVANVEATGTELGMMVGSSGTAGNTFIVGIPSDSTITHFALADSAGTAVLMVTQGV